MVAREVATRLRLILELVRKSDAAAGIVLRCGALYGNGPAHAEGRLQLQVLREVDLDLRLGAALRVLLGAHVDAFGDIASRFDGGAPGRRAPGREPIEPEALLNG